MSRLNEFRAAEEELRRQLEALDNLKKDASLQKELEFEAALKALMSEYEINAQQLIQILDPEYRSASKDSGSEKKTRKKRELRVYTNPHDGQTIETKGGNHKVLKEWKAKWGADEVESWKAQR